MAGRAKGTPIRLQPAPIVFQTVDEFKVEVVLSGKRLGFVELRLLEDRVDVIVTSKYGTESTVASFIEDDGQA